MCSFRSTTFVDLGSSLSAMLSSLQDTSGERGWHCPPPNQIYCSYNSLDVRACCQQRSWELRLRTCPCHLHYGTAVHM